MQRNRQEIEFDNIEAEENNSPAGASRLGYITYEETEGYLVDHIRGYLRLGSGKSHWGFYLPGYPKVTIHSCWSGYSEYTITSTWTEIGIEWNGYTAYFESAAAFFKALSEVTPISC